MARVSIKREKSLVQLQQEMDDFDEPQVDLDEIRESRLERTREVMKELDRDIAASVLPETHVQTRLSEDELEANAAISIQKFFRGYLGRKQYRDRLLKQYEKDEEERLRKQQFQTEEAELLVETARLQLEVEEDNSIHRNKQRMLNVCATRIQRAWKDYAARRSTNCTQKGDSFEEEIFRATGLKVDEVIGSHVTSTVSDQSDVRTDSFENTSILHNNSSDNEECHTETEDSNLVTATNSVETQHEADGIKTNNDVNLAAQKNDKRVRFTLPTSEDEESKEEYSGGTEGDHSANELSVPSDGISAVEETVEGDSDNFITSHSSVPDRVPVEQLHQMGYTQLRELKCSLETRLGTLSDELIKQLQQRERLHAHKEFLLEKIQNLSRLVQTQHKMVQKRPRIKS